MATQSEGRRAGRPPTASLAVVLYLAKHPDEALLPVRDLAEKIGVSYNVVASVRRNMMIIPPRRGRRPGSKNKPKDKHS